MAQGAKSMIADEPFAGRRHDNVVDYPGHIEKDGEGKNDNCNDGAHDMPPQRFQVINKAHLVGISAFVTGDAFEKTFSFGLRCQDRAII